MFFNALLFVVFVYVHVGAQGGLRYVVDLHDDNGTLKLLAGDNGGGMMEFIVHSDSTLTAVRSLVGGHSDMVRCAAFLRGSGGDGRIVTGGDDGTVVAWGGAPAAAGAGAPARRGHVADRRKARETMPF